jgi:hypothetical protein
MKLSFVLTPEDVIHFNRYHLRQTSGLLRRIFPYLIFLGFLIYVIYHSWDDFSWATALIIIVTGFLFFMLILGNQLLLRWHVKKIIKGNPSLTGKREIEVQNGMLYYRFNDRENQYDIQELVSVYENKHAIYIFDSKSYAIIVPQHAFHSRQEKEHFLGHVKAN